MPLLPPLPACKRVVHSTTHTALPASHCCAAAVAMLVEDTLQAVLPCAANTRRALTLSFVRRWLCRQVAIVAAAADDALAAERSARLPKAHRPAALLLVPDRAVPTLALADGFAGHPAAAAARKARQRTIQRHVVAAANGPPASAAAAQAERRLHKSAVVEVRCMPLHPQTLHAASK